MLNKLRTIATGLLLTACVMLTGCGPVQYFTDPDAKYEQKKVKDNDLEKNVYYVKDGTDFTSVYMPDGTVRNATERQDDSRVLWTTEQSQRLIPTLYSNEFIAYRSESTDPGDTLLERFYDVGYTLGVYNMTVDNDGYFAFSVKRDTVKGSSMNKIFQDANSDSIRIVAINGKTVDPDMINKSGVFLHLDKSKTYQLSFYAGTAYQSATVKADTRMYTSYETFDLGDGALTRKDYIRYDMPKGAKSGYYLVNGEGLFKYYAFNKGGGDEEKEKMNTPFYKNNNEQMKLYSQQYIVDVPQNTNDVSVYVKYATDVYADSDIICTLVAPDDTTYDMKVQDGTAKVSIAEAMAGKWTVNIYPKDLQVLDVGTESSAGTKKATASKKTYNIKKPSSNLQFCAEFEGNGTVWGNVTYEDGTSQDLMVVAQDKKSNTGRLSTTYAYAKKGRYTVTVYHYEDVKVTRIYRKSDEDNEENTIITVEG